MVNDEVLGGLRSSLERGESLKKAIATFLNAGYDKDEISEAAAILTNSPLPSRTAQSGQPPQYIQPQTGPMSESDKERLEFLRRTMLTLSSAGYNRQEIENAAMALEGLNMAPSLKQIKTAPVAQTIPGTAPPTPPTTISQMPQKNSTAAKPPITQKVSNYESKKSNKLVLVITLISIAFFLLAGLIAAFLFRDQLINFFNSLL